MEIAPGIHRIESHLGARFMAQYVLAGDGPNGARRHGHARDAGRRPAPLPRVPRARPRGARRRADQPRRQRPLGGNRALRDLHPDARFACHELDRRWVESNDALVAENYLWHEAYGFDEPDEAGRAELRASCGGDAPIDTGLRGGETIRLGNGWRVEVLHLPGHTLGHIGIWDSRSRAAIVIDAVLERGIYARDGSLLIPPRDLRP